MIESILLIDDSEPDNFLHTYLLNKANACNNIVSVLNVEAALEHLDKLVVDNGDLPAMIIVDINMPRLNGWEFFDIVRSNPKYDLQKTKFYMLTTSLNPDDRLKALEEYKLDGFYNKPINQTIIQELLNDAY